MVDWQAACDQAATEMGPPPVAEPKRAPVVELSEEALAVVFGGDAGPDDW